jgi:hypothetical protein
LFANHATPDSNGAVIITPSYGKSSGSANATVSDQQWFP